MDVEHDFYRDTFILTSYVIWDNRNSLKTNDTFTDWFLTPRDT